MLAIPMVLVVSLLSITSTQQQRTAAAMDAASCVGTMPEVDGDDEHGEGSTSGGATNKPPSVPFPTQDSSTIVWPVNGAVASSTYGPRGDVGGMGTNAFHDGTDFGAPLGTPVLSMADGIISVINRKGHYKDTYGEESMIEVQHLIKGQRYTTAYRHVQGPSLIGMKVGQKVKAGQQIAAVGSEGRSTGPHLHFVVANGPYHRWNSAKGPAGTVNSLNFLKSNGAVKASGGLDGTDFTGVESEADTSCDASAAETGLEGDGTGAWGGQKNGAVSPLGTALKVKLYSPAADDLTAMNAAYKKASGKSLPVTRGYMSLAQQQTAYDANKQIESPGESMFGWGRAIQLKVSFSSPAYKWLHENGDDFGWSQPRQFAADGSSSNAGLWTYVGGGKLAGVPKASSAMAAKNQAIAKKVMERDYPQWDSKDFVCLVKLWEHESNWNDKAENPTSGAYGIVQALPPTKMSTFGADWRTNPETQIEWGLDYIDGRYNSPCSAWAFWNETDPAKKHGYPGNWY